jgi:hypothetical protein
MKKGLLGIIGAVGAGLFFFLPKKAKESVLSVEIPGVVEGTITSPQDLVTVAVSSGDTSVMRQAADELRENGYLAQADVLDSYADGVERDGSI